ncbi:unnamed protein product [Spirodela intermedia]|uniref:CCHC-type domain-containing protein n=1 Tax=Spirodela intermedia TaxID=51605 RepID=A0A7I8IY00_SPIIN|nr:unnamed protein product [Spirodela intermedia]CAA6662737.1 unnamed protein product [Spirodela intermedia]
MSHEKWSPQENRNISTSSPRVISHQAWQNAAITFSGKTSDAGPKKGSRSVCSSDKTEKPAPLTQMDIQLGDRNKSTMPDLNESLNQYSDTAEALVSDAPKLGKFITPEESPYIKRFKYGKFAPLKGTMNENNGNMIAPVDEQRLVDTHESDLNEPPCKFTVGVLRLSDEEIVRTFKGKGVLIESPVSGNGNSLNEWKQDERTVSNDRTVSGEKTHSHESAESRNSKEPFATGKRVRDYGEDILGGVKRMRNSFTNWMSSLMKGAFTSDNMKVRPLSSVHKPGHKPGTSSNDGDYNGACRSTGFGSIFRSLYCSGLGKPMKVKSEELHFNNGTIKKDLDHVVHNDGDHDDDAELCRAFRISSIKHEEGICQFGEPPQAGLRRKLDKEECWNWDNVGASTSSSFNGSSSPSKSNRGRKLVCSEAMTFPKLSVKRKADKFPESLWIARFLPSVSAPPPYTSTGKQSSTPKVKGPIDCDMFLSRSHDDISSSVADWRISEIKDALLPHDQRPSSDHLHDYSISPIGSFSSKGIDSGQKEKNISSQMFTRLEPITSVFAKRLDAFRQIRISEASCDATPESVTCFFCGKNGHSMTTCSDAIKSELNYLMQATNSMKGDRNHCVYASSVFQHDHWAVACPYKTLSRHQIDSNNFSINPENFSRKIEGHRNGARLFDNQDFLLSDQGHDGGPRYLRNITEGQTSSNVGIADLRKLNALGSYQVNEKKGKRIASTPGATNSAVAPLPLSINTENEAIGQRWIFERIRKLHLSRADIIR